MTTTTASALEELMTRSIDDGTDRMSWLEARQGRITATMAAKLHLGGPSARRVILEESFQPPVEITGNKYIARGREREPAIAAWIQKFWPTIRPNTHLFAARENTRHAATPDGVGTSPSGALVGAEIKTSKYNRDPDDPYFPMTGYLEQMQWQMHVTGAIATLFVWEQHDDDWENGPHPLNEEPGWRWVHRDEALIGQLVAEADLALAERDRIAAERMGGKEEQVDVELAQLAEEVLAARTAKAEAEARLKAPWTRLLDHVSSRDEFSRPAGKALVTWSNRVETSYEPDTQAALAARVEGSDNLVGADLKERLDAAKGEWEAHLAHHVRPVERSLQRLTVTTPKPKAEPGTESEF